MSPRRPEHRRAHGLRARADVVSIVPQAATQWRVSMRVSHWLRPLAARLNPVRRRPTRPRPAFRPRVEGLEDRCLLSYAINEFPLPTPNSGPNVIVAGPDGNVWFMETN